MSNRSAPNRQPSDGRSRKRARVQKEYHDVSDNHSDMDSISTEHHGLSTYPTFSNSYTTEPYTTSAKDISKQMRNDKNECYTIITQYGINSNELLHLLAQWTQRLLFDYKQQREHFKVTLQEKWEREELYGITSNDNSNYHRIHTHIQKLQEWEKIGFPEIKRLANELQRNSDVKETTNKLIDNSLQIMTSIREIHQYSSSDNYNQQMKKVDEPDYLNETIKQLNRIKQINQEPHNTICIIGLEKAGKSSFINALLGFELLPYRAERCTQIQTILKPPLKEDPDRFYTIEFYDQDEFSRLIDKLNRKKGELEAAYKERIKSIHQARHRTITPNQFIRHESARSDYERERKIKDINSYISDELYLTIIKQITIYTTKLPGENYILLDVPGCDSPLEEHRLTAINAVKHADAFLFLTDGQRPSLTNDQVRLLNEIQDGHFDGMKRAFGIITKLDLCQTHTKYLEHRQKTETELKQKGFLPEHIFTVAANVSLFEATKSGTEQLTQIKQRIEQYDSLLDGFNECKKKLNDYVEYDLPHSRFQQVITMCRQKIFRYVQDALNLGRQLIPCDIIDGVSFEVYIKRMNAESWNDIFVRERYQPVLEKASYWQKDTLVLKREERLHELISYFRNQFQLCTKNILNQDHPIEEAMLKRPDISVFQMNPYDLETEERGKIVESMIHAVERTSDDLANYMYDKYVCELEKILNDICPEQADLFRNNLTVEQCKIQVKALVLRVSHPLIIATIRWPYTYKNTRIEAAKELIRIAPAIAFNIHTNNEIESIDNLREILGEILEVVTTDNVPMSFLMTLFQH